MVQQIFAFGVLAFHCVRVCVCLSVCSCISVCQRSVPTASEKKKDFVRSTRPGGGYGHREKTEHQAPLFSALGFVTSPAVSQRFSEVRLYARER